MLMLLQGEKNRLRQLEIKRGGKTVGAQHAQRILHKSLRLSKPQHALSYIVFSTSRIKKRETIHLWAKNCLAFQKRVQQDGQGINGKIAAA